MADSRDDFTSAPLRMTLGLLFGGIAAIYLGVTLLGESAAGGAALIASSMGPLFVLGHAHRRAQRNRIRNTTQR